MHAGFVGSGHMGRGMVLSLIRAGHDVRIYNRTRTAAEALAGDGATVAENIKDACGGDVVFTMLSNDDAVEAVVFGTGGILEIRAP